VVRWGGSIISSGGTAAFLRDAGLEVTTVEELTGVGSLFGGRVKTLHPRIHGGILFRRRDPEDVKSAEQAGIEPIDLVVVNLYPFASAVESGASEEDTIELIDVGGPAMVRAAAKNHHSVAVVTLPEDYGRVRAALDEGEGSLSEGLRRDLAGRAFRVTAEYDGLIADYFAGTTGGSGTPVAAVAAAGPAPVATPPTGQGLSELPAVWQVSASRRRTLRYGENPSQRGGLYGTGTGFPFDLEQLHGKELSYNNILDLGCGRDVMAEFAPQLVAVVIKHGIPCGVAHGQSLAEAYRRARDADSLSAYGGVVLLNREVDVATAELLNETFLEVVLAPAFKAEAQGLLEKKKSRILLRCPLPSLVEPAGQLRGRFVGSGFLLQTPMPPGLGESEWKVVTRRSPDEGERADLLFGWKVLKHVRSNGVLMAKNGQTVGVGSGQCSRIDSTRIALAKAAREGLDLHGAVLVSDAFFPFRDSIDAAAKAGVTAVLQPGGSVRDEESIQACDEQQVAMVVNGARVFSHG
jgi:phosphoribosylaminoimidazolecarboxamide formyltransferase / IMP cyclohydrolase